MPFEKQVQKLLSEGLNLLPPSDLIGEGEAEKCVNWRPDQLGKLVARFGQAQLASGMGDWVHTIAHVESPPSAGWFVGCDEKLWYYGAVDTIARVNDAITAAAAVFDGDFLGWASYQGFLFVMNKLKRGRVVIDQIYPWLPDPPAAAPAVAKIAGNLSGGVRYYVTWETDRAYESNPSPVSAEISDAAATFGVTVSLPTSTNPEVTAGKINVYRQGGLLPVPYLVYQCAHGAASIDDDGGLGGPADNIDPTVWPLSDAMAIEYGKLMEDDHDPPPAAFGLAGPYYERLLAFNSADHPNRIWYTPSLMPWFFRGSATDDGDWVDVGEEGEPIYAISVKPHMVLIYKAHSIWRVLGDFETGTLELVTPHIGICGPRAWASHGSVDYIRAPEGIYLVTGERAYKVSDKVDPIFKGRWSGKAEPTPPLDPSQDYYEVLAIKLDRLYHAYTEES